MAFAIEPFSGSLWRMIHPSRQRFPFSGEGARLYGGRWNMKGWPALYLATDYSTAVAEYHREAIGPGMLVPYRLEATAIVDLTDATDSRVKHALAADWKTIAGIDGKVPPNWTLAQELIAAGAEGALVPSMQNKGGTNLVLWRWHDAGEQGEGAALSLLDPDRALAGR